MRLRSGRAHSHVAMRLRKEGDCVDHCRILEPIHPDRPKRKSRVQGRSPGSRFEPSARLPGKLQWPLDAHHRLQLRGQLRTWAEALTEFPVIPSRGPWTRRTLTQSPPDVNRDIKISLYPQSHPQGRLPIDATHRSQHYMWRVTVPPIARSGAKTGNRWETDAAPATVSGELSSIKSPLALGWEGGKNATIREPGDLPCA
jgi:hypothetical protein